VNNTVAHVERAKFGADLLAYLGKVEEAKILYQTVIDGESVDVVA
jgi:hypothetical protein